MALPFIAPLVVGAVGALWGRDKLFGDDSPVEDFISRFQWGAIFVCAVGIYAYLKFRKK